MAILEKSVAQRTINAIETKNKIFTTAIKLFKKYGYDKVTIEDITKQAKVSKGNFYTHFSSKDSVLAEQFHKIDEYYDEVFSAVPESTSASQRLLILIKAMTEYCAYTCGIEVMRVVYASQINNAIQAKVRILNNKERRVYTHLRDIVALGKRTNEFTINIPDEEIVELLMRSSRAIIYDWCLYGDDFDVVVEAQGYFKTVLFCLRARQIEADK